MQEMENLFSESSIDLLRCMACLDPKNDFAAFDADKLAHLGSLYPKDFSLNERTMLLEELELFVGVMIKGDRLIGIEDLGCLARKMVETKKHIFFPIVDRLIELILLFTFGNCIC